MQKKEIYSVSKLTKEIKALLENTFPYVWIFGEISNLRIPSSGHCYFTLKDNNSQISAVIFKGQAARLKFRLEDGQSITGLCRLSLYEPRGSYQLIFEFIEPKGTGALQLAFEQLKRKLADEGLFDSERKTPLPRFPKRIALVTSSSGAVVHDMMTTFRQRYPQAELLIVPVNVQGERAVREISMAFDILNRHPSVDLIILARGGGSLEDLAPFNTEAVARAISKSMLPVVSAVGHETDYTIADFTADMRAPTPTAAATLAVPDARQLRDELASTKSRLVLAMSRRMKEATFRAQSASQRLVDPRKKIYDHRLRLDDLAQRLNRGIHGALRLRQDAANGRHRRLWSASPLTGVAMARQRSKSLSTRLSLAVEGMVSSHRQDHQRLSQSLRALSPEGVLERGYSIIRRSENGDVVTRASQADAGTALDIVLYDGVLETLVQRRKDGKKKI